MGARCLARGGMHDPLEQVYVYNFIDNGLIYSERGGRKIFLPSMEALLRSTALGKCYTNATTPIIKAEISIADIEYL